MDNSPPNCPKSTGVRNQVPPGSESGETEALEARALRKYDRLFEQMPELIWAHIAEQQIDIRTELKNSPAAR